MFWGVREKKESINKFLQDNGMTADKISLSRKIFYRLSSDINHKMLAFQINHSLTIKRNNIIHDRFLIIDDDIYSIGSSIKDVGKKRFVMTKIISISKQELLKNI